MKDKDFKKHKKRVEKVAQKWINVLGLKWWDIKINYVDDCGYSKHDPSSTVTMTSVALWQYLDAEIDVAIPVVAMLDDDELERSFLHECVHILLNETRSKKDSENHEERVCQTLVKAFKWVEELL